MMSAFVTTCENLDRLLDKMGSAGTIRLWVSPALDEVEKGGQLQLKRAAIVRAEAIAQAAGGGVVTETCEEFIPSDKSARDRVEEIRLQCEAKGLQFIYGQRSGLVRF